MAGGKRIFRGGVRVLDMACGAGANTLWMANRHRDVQFIGVDIDKECIEQGNKVLEQNLKYGNCRLCEGDWFDPELGWVGVFDGIISFQSLLMFPDYREALRKLAVLQPKWIAVSSLFYEGDIEYTNKFRNYYRPSNGQKYTDSYYNIHSTIRFRECVRELGYLNFEYIPYDIDIDLPKPENKDIGTYTVNTSDGRRIQISGGMMMPWYFAVAYK